MSPRYTLAPVVPGGCSPIRGVHGTRLDEDGIFYDRDPGAWIRRLWENQRAVNAVPS